MSITIGQSEGKGGQANYLLNDLENSGRLNEIPPVFSAASESVLKEGMSYTDITTELSFISIISIHININILSFLVI